MMYYDCFSGCTASSESALLAEIYPILLEGCRAASKKKRSAAPWLRKANKDAAADKTSHNDVIEANVPEEKKSDGAINCQIK